MEKNSHFTAIFHPIAMHSTELSHEAPHALKGQKLLAQGIALGILAISKAPCKGKSFKIPGDKQSFCPYYYICTWKNKEVKIFISANFC